jgi:hypothetical protein
MLDTPTNASSDGGSPPQPTPTNLVALWMTNSIGLRAIRYVGWARRANAVAVRNYSGSPVS